MQSIFRSRNLRTIALTACFLAIGAAAPNAGAYEKDKTYALTVLHTNDHHGRFWKDRNGQFGMAARKTLIDGIRADVKAAGGHVLLLSGGDINTGVPESDLQDAEPDFKGMKMLGYDAMALGNHEFDNELSVLRRQREWAGFPFLSANTLDKETGKPLINSHVVFDLDGLKVTVVGFTTEDTAKIGNPEYLSGIEFKSPIDVAMEIVPALRRQTDILIAATHMGHYAKGEHGGNAPGDVSLARAVKGLDIIIGGHSQDPLPEPDIQNGTMILQAHEWGKYVGRMDLSFKNGELTLEGYRLIPVNLKKRVKINGRKMRYLLDQPIAEDPEMLAFLKPFQDVGQEKLGQIIGKADGDFIGERNKVRFMETNLGMLIGRAQRDKAGADIAIMNSGGIRTSLPSGDITYKDVLKVQPFANAVAAVTLTGAELRDYLKVVASKPTDTGAFAHFVGVTFRFSDGALHDLKVNGAAVVDDQSYRMAINSYIAAGGDGYPKMTAHPNFVNTGYVDADVLKEYIQAHTPLATGDYAPSGDVKR